MTPTTNDTSAARRRDEAAPIKAKPLPHPGRWITAAILLALAAWFVVGAARNEAYRWDVYFQYLFDTRIATAALHTLALTVLSWLGMPKWLDTIAKVIIDTLLYLVSYRVQNKWVFAPAKE